MLRRQSHPAQPDKLFQARRSESRGSLLRGGDAKRQDQSVHNEAVRSCWLTSQETARSTRRAVCDQPFNHDRLPDSQPPANAPPGESDWTSLWRWPRGYFASRSVKSFALEQRISSICRRSKSALNLSASICSLNEASSWRRRVISAFRFGPTAFQTRCADMTPSPAWARIREPETWLEVEALLVRMTCSSCDNCAR